MKLLKSIVEILLALTGYQENDPVKYCTVYKINGCAHVDGMHCSFPNCKILIDYEKKGEMKPCQS